MTTHFSLAEVESHRLCERHGIPIAENKIPVLKGPGIVIATQQEWLLGCELLEQARSKLGQPITISCGYRAPKLNSLCGGAAGSQHQGCRRVRGAAGSIEIIQSVAFDLQTPQEADLLRLFEILLTLPHDQLILEDRTRGKDWVHWSWNPFAPNRGQNFILNPTT